MSSTETANSTVEMWDGGVFELDELDANSVVWSALIDDSIEITYQWLQDRRDNFLATGETTSEVLAAWQLPQDVQNRWKQEVDVLNIPYSVARYGQLTVAAFEGFQELFMQTERAIWSRVNELIAVREVVNSNISLGDGGSMTYDYRPNVHGDGIESYGGYYWKPTLITASAVGPQPDVLTGSIACKDPNELKLASDALASFYTVTAELPPKRWIKPESGVVMLFAPDTIHRPVHIATMKGSRAFFGSGYDVVERPELLQ